MRKKKKMTDFTRILDKAKELESKMKESQEKIKNIQAEGSSGSNSIQVTLNGDLVRVVASFQNAPKTDLEAICLEFFNREQYTIEALHCNPAGDWAQGGFDADAGVTGRKLAVDNYGPRVPLGGGAFSGKDATKVDRSAAYIARFIAVKLLEASKAKEVLVRLAYAIGHDQPLEATAIVDGSTTVIRDYDLSPKGIIEFLDLKK